MAFKKTILTLQASALLFAQNVPAQPSQCDSAFYAEKTVFGKKKTVLTMDFSSIRRPASVEAFKPVFHFPPVRQDTTNTCWAFSGISFLESEIFRIHGRKIKLSEMYTVYWEYVEKARRYVQKRGDSKFPEGSEHEAVILRIQQYGTVPGEAYTGLLPGRTKHNHTAMVEELQGYLDYVKNHSIWDEEQVLTSVRLIQDKHMGKPPETVRMDGRILTPKAYAEQVVRLPLEDYVNLMSFTYVPFYTKGEFKVEDNWWHSKEYYNLPLEEWFGAVKRAIRNGYSLAIGGDVSESGKSRDEGIFVIPDFDLSQDRINQSSREFRFTNHTTEDDHGIHLVGWTQSDGHDWFLLKDSAASAHDGAYKGYYFYRDDCVRLKMLTFMVHRDAVADLLEKCEHPTQGP